MITQSNLRIGMKHSIPFSKVTTDEQEIEAVSRIIRSGWLAAGEETRLFEEEFSNYISPKGEHYYCIFTNSCTSALKMAFKYYKEQGYKHYCLLTPNTFCATYASAEEIGLTPSEIEPGGIVRVATHYGSVRYNNILPYNIEDSAHRIEPNDPLIGKIRCYSFYATKNMTTAGAGGMFVTNNKEIYERARLYWRDGLSSSTADRLKGNPFYRVEVYSGGYDGNDIAAAIGRVQIKKLPEFTRRRNEIRDRYNTAFGQTWSGNHLYPYFVTSEQEVKDLIEYLKEKGIGCGYHYPGSHNWLGVSLPIYPLLTEVEIGYIIDSIKDWEFNEKGKRRD